MGPIGYAVAYRTLHRPEGAPAGRSRPVRPLGGVLARLTLVVLLVALGIVALLDGDWWLAIPLVLVAMVVGVVTLLGGPGAGTAPPVRPVGPDRPPREV